MPRKTKQNDITSPELLAKINPDNMRLKNDFLEYLRSVQRSPMTINGYSNDLDIVLTWNYLYNGSKNFVNITKRNWTAFQSWLINENGNSPARVRRLKSAISSMSNYISDVLDDEDEYKDFKPNIRKIENPVNQPVRDKTVLTDEQMQMLLDTLVSKGKYDKACMAALAMYSGRRKSELVRFRVDDFKDENLVCDGALYKTSDKIKTKGFGLGKYIYCYTLAKKFKPYLDMWLDERKRIGIDSEWLFPMREDPTKQMRADTLDSWAKTFSKILETDFYFHSLRHLFTSNLVREGMPDGVIQEIVGWTSADMVRVYTDIDADEQIGMWFKDGEVSAPKNGMSF